MARYARQSKSGLTSVTGESWLPSRACVAQDLQVLRSGDLLFGVTPTDPMTFLVVSIALLVVTTLACGWPAIRALKVQPAEALRLD